MHWGRASAPHSTGGVSREQIDEFITFPFHGKAARIIVPHLPPPQPHSLAVPPQRPPLILKTAQLRPARITNAARPASSLHGWDTKRGSKGKRSMTPPPGPHHPHLLHPPDWQATLEQVFSDSQHPGLPHNSCWVAICIRTKGNSSKVHVCLTPKLNITHCLTNPDVPTPQKNLPTREPVIHKQALLEPYLKWQCWWSQQINSAS